MCRLLNRRCYMMYHPHPPPPTLPTPPPPLHWRRCDIGKSRHLDIVLGARGGSVHHRVHPLRLPASVLGVRRNHQEEAIAAAPGRGRKGRGKHEGQVGQLPSRESPEPFCRCCLLTLKSWVADRSVPPVAVAKQSTFWFLKICGLVEF